MTSDWDGTAWGGTAVAMPKASTGPGVAFFNNDVPLPSFARSPQRLMREAQAAYHQNPWVRSAENAVTRKVANVPWHLEDEKGDEIGDKANEKQRLVRDLIEKPQSAITDRRQMTHRELWSITSRHMGLCGMAYWFLDQVEQFGKTPLSILYVNPARVWPVEDANGNLTGWVLDAKDELGHGGTPLRRDELLVFYLDPPDSGHYGSGLVETAALKAQITNAADRHALYLLLTGGRLAGIVSPKGDSIPDEQFKALVREFRNITEAPDAAKRTTILQGPVDFTATAATPEALNLLDLSKMNRDDIFAIWGVPPSQGAIPSPAGLNSGETRKYDEATLWQGAVHDRLVSIRETIQYQLLDRYSKLGIRTELVIEEPTFDDRAPAFELAAKSLNVPLRNRERRELLGLDPLGIPELDDQVLLPATVVPLFSAPEAAKAALPKPRTFIGLRAAAERMVPGAEKTLRAVLRAQLADIAARLRERAAHLVAKPKDIGVWWNQHAEDARLTAALRGHVAGIGELVGKRTTELLREKAPAKADVNEIVAALLRTAGTRITGINETTRDLIRDYIAEGFAEGLGPAEIADRMEADTPGAKWDPEYRAELIARTETMFAYNSAALESYRGFGVGQVQAIDGDQDEVCAARNGNVYSVDEAADIEDHPNGTLDWVPYFAELGALA